MPDQYFVSCRDAGKTALVLGPFTNEKDCRRYAYSESDEGGSSEYLSVNRAVCELDGKAHFASWGMLRIKDVKENEKYQGFLNKVNPEVWDKVLS